VVDDAVDGEAAEVVLLDPIDEGFLVGGIAAEDKGLR
jgi:hypothetical protein